jgi:hypothetical protein
MQNFTENRNTECIFWAGFKSPSLENLLKIGTDKSAYKTLPQMEREEP